MARCLRDDHGVGRDRLPVLERHLQTVVGRVDALDTARVGPRAPRGCLETSARRRQNPRAARVATARRPFHARRRPRPERPTRRPRCRREPLVRGHPSERCSDRRRLAPHAAGGSRIPRRGRPAARGVDDRAVRLVLDPLTRLERDGDPRDEQSRTARPPFRGGDAPAQRDLRQRRTSTRSPSRLRPALLGDTTKRHRDGSVMTRSRSDVIRRRRRSVRNSPTAAHLGAAARTSVVRFAESFWMSKMPNRELLRSPMGRTLLGQRPVSDPRWALSLDAYERGKGVSLVATRAARGFCRLRALVPTARGARGRPAPCRAHRRGRRRSAGDARGRGVDRRPTRGRRGRHRAIRVSAGRVRRSPRELATHSSEHAEPRAVRRSARRRRRRRPKARSSAPCFSMRRAPTSSCSCARRGSMGRTCDTKGSARSTHVPRTDVGPAFVSHLVARPRILRWQPRVVQREALRRALQRALRSGSGHDRRACRSARAAGSPPSPGVNGHVRLGLDDATSRDVEHVLLATGYRVDIRRYPFLSPTLAAAVRCADGYPSCATVSNRRCRACTSSGRLRRARSAPRPVRLRHRVRRTSRHAVDHGRRAKAADRGRDRPRVRVPVRVTTDVIVGANRRGALVLGSDYKALGIVRSLGGTDTVWVLRDEHVIASHSRTARAVSIGRRAATRTRRVPRSARR